MPELIHVAYKPNLIKYDRPPYQWYVVQNPKYYFSQASDTWFRRFFPLMKFFPHSPDIVWDAIVNGTQLVFSVYKNNKIASFLLIEVFHVQKIKKYILYFHAGAISPQHRTNGLTNKMTHLNIKHLKGSWHGQFFSVRTFNPRVLGATRRLSKVYPSPECERIPPIIKYVGYLLAKEYFRDLENFDVNTFIFRNAYPNTEIFFKNGKLNVQLDKDNTNNEWLFNRISHKNGDSQLFVGLLTQKNVLQFNYFKFKPF